MLGLGFAFRPAGAPAPLDDPARDRGWKPLSDQTRTRYECILADTCAVSVPVPATKQVARLIDLAYRCNLC